MSIFEWIATNSQPIAIAVVCVFMLIILLFIALIGAKGGK